MSGLPRTSAYYPNPSFGSPDSSGGIERCSQCGDLLGSVRVIVAGVEDVKLHQHCVERWRQARTPKPLQDTSACPPDYWVDHHC